MPLMRIDMVKGRRTPDEIKKVMQLSYDLTRKDLGVPEDDRFQVVTQHEAYEMKLMDAGLGIERTDDILLFEILSTPRTMGQKKKYCQDMAEAFHTQMGMKPEDIMIVFATNHAEDFSFGNGKQQFLNGEL
ncbi:tautomerase family protein [Fructilactobacillus hinvesii]|uniref:Tautomerase family protein n=1 Tax=Fructilactobacillus hinvesii TaxID=2940300 RepID=A0ABY5BSM0_9LACO|nr:tautomerase family protein [Fructilactobacillus hinvesii]USS87930.1 tautomerase family protein [Fructilactobacillus hinvesii]